jgi:hypothetical protein
MRGRRSSNFYRGDFGMTPDPNGRALAACFAAMDDADRDLRAVTATLTARDALMDARLDDIFARLSVKPTRRIGDHNENFR